MCIRDRPYLESKYRNSVRCDDYAFYGFLFEDAAICLDTKIEKFFEPCIPKCDNYKDKSSKLIRKTISKLYLKCIKKSNFFMLYLNKYVDQLLTQEVEGGIKNKISHIISDWDECRIGIDKSLNPSQKANKLRFSWTLMDIEVAVKHLFEYLGDISD